MKIAILEEKTVTGGSFGNVNFDDFYTLGDVVKYPLTPQDILTERLCDVDAAIINKTVFTKAVIQKCKSLKYIGLCATGYNNVDLKAADEHGIVVTNCPCYSTDAVAEQVFSYIMAFSKKTAEYNEDVHNMGWVNSDTFSYFAFPTTEISGITLGIYGMGAIGTRVSQIANAFNMNVIAYSRTVKNIPGVKFVSKEELFKQSDIITLHCPLTPETENLICTENLSLCKKSAFIINTSRGNTVNEQELAAALNNGIIAGAAVDVVSKEPMEKDNPLLYAKNIYITPHISWAPVQTRKRLLKIAFDNLKAFCDGHPINQVNGK